MLLRSMVCIVAFSITTMAHSDDVLMAFGESIPPFSFPDTNTGIEIEVIGEALAYKGHVLKPEYFPLARVPFVFKMKRVDAAMTDLGEDMQKSGAFYGEPAVTYNNVFIGLKDKNLTITKPEDLNGLTVLSFQGAIKRYPTWLGPVSKAGNYFEQNNQELQVMTLMLGRFDLVLSDVNIFKYHLIQMQKKSKIKLKSIQFHSFNRLNPLDYRPVFASEKIRDDFNKGLAVLKSSGRFQAIYDKYLTAPVD